MPSSNTQQKVRKKASKELPYNEEAERVVLGSAMIKKDYGLDVLNSLEVDDFYLGKHIVLFKVINENFILWKWYEGLKSKK